MESKKTILIFGGGENQLTLIKAAKTLGVRSVVIDPNPEAPGKVTADHFEVVGPTDYELTKKIAFKYRVDGIVTSQMENPLRIMARLAHELNYIFPSPEVIERCRNKYLMKQAFIENEIPCARGILIKSEEDLNTDKLKDFTFPVIIKPIDSHSSSGVYRVNDYNELKQFEKQTRSFSIDQSLIIEEFIDGKEYSVESLTHKGKTSIIQITEKIITEYPYTVELGHIQPAALSKEEKTEVEQIVIKAIRALGIDNSAAHSELKINMQRLVILEIGARLGGDFIASYLTLASTGVNMDEGAINIALGNKPDVDSKLNNFSCIKYIELPVGKTVNEILPIYDILMDPDIVYAHIFVKPGDVIQPINHSGVRPACFLIKMSKKEEMISKTQLLDETIKQRILTN